LLLAHPLYTDSLMFAQGWRFPRVRTGRDHNACIAEMQGYPLSSAVILR
jgi:hypothetical protein